MDRFVRFVGWPPRRTAVVLTIVLALTACASGPTTTSTAEGSASTAEGSASTAEGTSAPDFSDVTLVGYTFGGLYQDGIQNVFCGDLETSTGATCSMTSGGSVANVAKVIAEKGDPQADFLLVDDALIPELIANDAIVPIDFSKVPNTKGYFAVHQEQIKGFDNYFLPILTQQIGLAYRADLIAEAGLPAPTNFADLWDPVYKGKVLLNSFDNNFSWAFVQVAAAVRCGDPKDVECGFEEIKKLKESGQVAVVTNNTTSWQKALVDGQAWLGEAPDSRTFTLVDQGVNLTFINPADYQLANTTGLVAVRDANYDALMILFNLAADPRLQAKYLDPLGHGPTHVETRDYLSGRALIRVPSTESKFLEFTVPDWDYLRAFRVELTERFNDEILK